MPKHSQNKWSLLLLISLLLTALAFTATADYKRINSDNADDPLAVQIFQLDNGLTVYLTENHETPRFYAEIAVRAGSKHDPAETTGLAHYLEHLLFKGTQHMGTLSYAHEKEHLDKIEALYEEHFRETDPEKRADIYAQINEASLKAADQAIPNEIDRLYSSMGGTAVNAHTYHEETVYKVSLPANRMRQWAAVESERFVDPVFRLFPTELETVYEELNRSLDNKGRIIMRAVDEQLFKVHAYGQQPTIGTADHLKNPSIKNIKTYFATYYVPNNMGIFISGDIDAHATIEIIDEYFSTWEEKRVPRLKKKREKRLDGREEVLTAYEGEEYVLLAFRTAKNSHKDAEPLAVLDMILDNATAGLINLNLNQKQLVRAAGSYPFQFNDYGTQYLYGIPKQDQTLEEVEALLLEQIEIIKQGEIEDWLIPAIINDFKKTLKAGQESDLARVSVMRASWIGIADWEHTVAQMKRFESVSKKDVTRIANKYFGDNYVVGFRKDAPHEVPAIEKPTLATIDIDPSRQSPFAESIHAIPFDPIAPVFVDPEKDYKVIDYGNGRILYYAPNPLNDLFSFSIAVEVGTHTDKKLAIAARLRAKSGTNRFSAEELNKEWYKLGSSFSGSSSANRSFVSLSGLNEQFDASMTLMMELLNTPSVDAETLEEMKKIILVQRADAKKQAPSIAGALEEFNRYGSESTYLQILPEAELNTLTVEELQQATQNLLDYEHVVSYTGTLPLDEIEAMLSKHYPIKDTLKEASPYHFRRFREIDNTEIYFVDKKEAQANARLEFGSVNYEEAMNPAAQLYNGYFAGGMAGIVFQELREARALAYMAAARFIEGGREKEQGRMVGVIQTQADKTLEALEAFIDLLDNLPESEDRFATARQAIVNRYRTAKLGFRSVTGAVRSWERLGLEPDPRRARYTAIQDSSLETILQFHRQYIANKPKLISIVGDSEKIDLEKLAEIGTVKIIPLEKIFVE